MNGQPKERPLLVMKKSEKKRKTGEVTVKPIFYGQLGFKNMWWKKGNGPNK